MTYLHSYYNPYYYVYNNPIKFYDPNGLDSLDAKALTAAAEETVSKIISDHGSKSAQCNKGVSLIFSKLTGRSDLSEKTANEIYDFLNSSKLFETVEQSEVQEIANDGKIIIGAKKETNSGHVVIGVPGEEESSGSWGEKVPQVMDTGSNKRSSKQKISFSWSSTSKDNINYYKFRGSTYTSRVYKYSQGNILNPVVIKGSGSKAQKIQPRLLIDE